MIAGYSSEAATACIAFSHAAKVSGLRDLAPTDNALYS